MRRLVGPFDMRSLERPPGSHAIACGAGRTEGRHFLGDKLVGAITRHAVASCISRAACLII
jgi:hypothetical protein